MKICLIGLISFYGISVFSQEIPIAYLIEEKSISLASIQKKDPYFHVGFFPYLFLNKTYDSIVHQHFFVREKDRNKSANFYYKSVYYVKDSDFVLHINPIMNYTYANDSTLHPMENTRGVIISGQLSNKFRFVTGATETQAFYRKHVNYYRKKNLVVPGGGRARPFKQTGYDFSNSFGYLIYSFSPQWHVMFGHTRQFVGYGYRSVLLSDAPFEYPVIRIDYTRKRWQYICQYATYQSATEFDDRTKVFSRKYSSLHYLSFYPHKRMEVGIFENTLFRAMSLSRNRPPEEFYLPILLSQTLLYGFSKPNNVLLGFQAQVVPFDELRFYGQMAIDDYNKSKPTQNKIAWQYGMKMIEPLGFKNFFMLAEYNQSTSHTYTTSEAYSIFSQHNEPIAHILGNYFDEFVLYAYYRYRIAFIQFKLNRAYYLEREKRLEPNPQTERNRVDQFTLESGIILHKPSRLTLSVKYHHRQSFFSGKDEYIVFGLKTRFFNVYDDF